MSRKAPLQLGYIDLAMTDERARIKEYYDLLADSYDQLYGAEQAGKHAKILKELGGTRFDVFIEVGCGTGTLLEQVAPRCSLAVGVDVSLRMLQRARSRVNRDHTEYVVADYSALPFRNRVCDGVISVSLLKLKTDRRQFSELARILKPAGTFSVTVFHFENTDYSQATQPSGLWEEVRLTARESLLLARGPNSQRRLRPKL